MTQAREPELKLAAPQCLKVVHFRFQIGVQRLGCCVGDLGLCLGIDFDVDQVKM